MAKSADPLVLELAPLPREQVGPFLLLGLPKNADKEQLEANWAQRVIWARKSSVAVPLEDVNWSREVLNDADRRVRADAASLNVDTTDGVLARLTERYGVTNLAAAGWQPLDVEKPLADYTPATEVPDPGEVRRAITVPEVPQELPAVAPLLVRFLHEPLDPWKVLSGE
jgi:hypothetical protein